MSPRLFLRFLPGDLLRSGLSLSIWITIARLSRLLEFLTELKILDCHVCIAISTMSLTNTAATMNLWANFAQLGSLIVSTILRRSVSFIYWGKSYLFRKDGMNRRM